DNGQHISHALIVFRFEKGARHSFVHKGFQLMRRIGVKSVCRTGMELRVFEQFYPVVYRRRHCVFMSAYYAFFPVIGSYVTYKPLSAIRCRISRDVEVLIVHVYSRKWVLYQYAVFFPFCQRFGCALRGVGWLRRSKMNAVVWIMIKRRALFF